jgi:cation diffusion facilitator family transporter
MVPAMDSELPAHHAATQARARSGQRLILSGIALNAFLAAVKIAAGIVGHAYALIADGAESGVDVISSLLVWTGVRVAGRPPDEDHPYGHGRAEPLATLAVAGVTFLAIAWIAAHAIHLIVTPHPCPYWATLPLLAATVAAKLWHSRRLRAAGAAAGSTALGFEAWHQGSDAFTSAAAFVGIAIAVIGGPGWEAADDWAALFACMVIAAGGVTMLRKALGEMMDAAPPPDLEHDVRAIASATPGVRALDKCRVRKSGLSHLVDIHIRVDGELSVREGHAIAHAVKDALLASPLGVTDVSVHVEPMG